MKKRAFFLDRDGVIIEQVSYLHTPDAVKLIPGTIEALQIIHQHGDLAICISNQSGIGRGMFTMEDLEAVHQEMLRQLLDAQAILDDTFYCPHAPELNCICRKPQPEMIWRAAAKYDIDIGKSVMVGDRHSDLTTGVNAGCALNILVKTGYGAKEADARRAEGFTIAEDLLDAVKIFYNGK